MLHIQDPAVKALLLKGSFGLEKESLRVTPEGYLAHTPHPFPDNNNIVRDFGENQTEINTPVFSDAHAAVEALMDCSCQIQKKLRELPEREILWPFSNPPFIRNERDIPVARFFGKDASKTAYREYLSDRYGRYKMTLSGIHVNYSFDEALLQADYAAGRRDCPDFEEENSGKADSEKSDSVKSELGNMDSGENDFREYKDQFYVELAEKTAAYGWILTAVTAASPLMDSSFVEKGRFGMDEFSGMASVRCSELGYWNTFAPIFDYSSLQAYADSIQEYVDEGLLAYPSELYYPVRLKPAGKNSLESLKANGVNHIELRMFDLNPLTEAGVDERDIVFAQLLLVWLAASPRRPFSKKDQVQAVQNFKNAAHYDLKTVKIVAPDGEVCSVAHAASGIIDEMKQFYKGYPDEIRQVLDFEEAKFVDADNRYAWIIRRRFGGSFVEKGLQLAEALQKTMTSGKNPQ